MMSHRSPVLKRVLHAMGLVPLLFSVICWPGLEASASEPATAEPATAELAAQRGVPKPEIFPVAPATPDVWSQEVEASEGGPGIGARGKPPPTLVDLVMHYVLIERDLDHARVLLADGLVNALNEVSNRAWTARLYALMAALEVLEGDQQNARRLALRAVTLEPGVRIEGELGERVEGTLRWAKRTWKKRKKSATIRASQLPHRLTLYLDGRVLETPQDIPLRPGDHLLQVVGTIGVVARGWLTLQEGARLEDPDPLGEVQRALLPPEDTAEPLAQEELEALVDDARSARQDTQALTAEVGMELTMARSSSRIERAACLAEQQHRLKRFDHAMKAYNERLQKAMERDDADEVRHLFKMIGLARDEAVRQRNAINTCMNRPEPDHPVEVRMTNAPAPPPIGEERPGVSPERVPFQVALDAPVDYDSRLTTRWPPPQDVWRPPINAPYHAAVNPNRLEEEGSSLWSGGLWVEGAMDSNPNRALQDLAAEAPIPELMLVLTPHARLEGTYGFLDARYKAELGQDLTTFDQFQTAGRLQFLADEDAKAPNVRLGASLMNDLIPIESVAALEDSFNRLAGEARLTLDRDRPGDSLESEFEAVMRRDQLTAGEGATATDILGIHSTVSGVIHWRIFPYSVLVTDFSVGTSTYGDNYSEGRALTAGQRQQRYARIRMGVEGQVKKGLTLQARAGYQTHQTVIGTGDVAFLPPESSIIGFARLTKDEGLVWLSVTVQREVIPAFYADAIVSQSLEARLHTQSTGRLRFAIMGRGGTDQLFVLQGAGSSGASPGYASATQTFLSARGELYLRWGDGRFSPDLLLHYEPSLRWGVTDLSSFGGGSSEEPGQVGVHRLFLGLHLQL